jgi:transcriptional regulator with XRE-family HTH domain
MARDNSSLGPSARHVAREYARARAQGVTQEEFARNAGLGSGRYLRKILSGERSGRVLEKRAVVGGSYTVPVSYQGTEASVNIRLPGDVSRIDVYQPKVQRAIKRELAKAQREEKLRTRPSDKISDTNTARLRGMFKVERMRYARTIHRPPVVVLP